MAESYSELDRGQLAALLEHLHDKYNNPDFIESDPISVPHTFSSRATARWRAFWLRR